MPGTESNVSALITCEHASNAVPALWRDLFAGSESVLQSHRGWDPGTLELAGALASRLGAPMMVGAVTRLLVDLNRSESHPRRFSEFTRPLPEASRIEITERWWRPHWQAYREYLGSLPGQVVHIACHSFTPVMKGRQRSTDIGLLHDPSRKREKAWCRVLAGQLHQRLPNLKVHMNQPYKGVSNGLGQQHRRHFPDSRLITMEIEINQRLVDQSDWPETIQAVSCAAESALKILRRQ